MTKEEVIAYKVIKKSEKSKEEFNGWLMRNDIVLVGSFRNEYGELFVIYKNEFNKNIPEYSKSFNEIPDTYGITGDELGWDLGYTWNNDRLSCRFSLTPEERGEVIKILSKL